MNFEGHKLRGPVGYDEILTKQYGDYMTPPPVEKQVTHHSNKVYGGGSSIGADEFCGWCNCDPEHDRRHSETGAQYPHHWYKR